MQVKSAPKTDEPPRLERIVDLGGLDLGQGALPEDESDGFATPGEWLALLGSGLTAQGHAVRFGKREVVVNGYTADGGLIVRVPRGLPDTVAVSVKTTLGESRLPLAIESYVVVADVGASKLRFFPSEGPRLNEELEGVSLPGLRAAVLSGDGALLYAVSAKPGQDERSYRLVAVHMGAKEVPAVVADYDLPLDGPPTALALSADDRRLFVLSETGLRAFELERRTTLRARGALSFSPAPASEKCAARSLVMLEGGQKAAVLDSVGDRLLLVDTAGAPQLLSSLDLKPPDAPSNAPPTSFDVVADETDPRAVWLLQGPNSHFAGRFLVGLSDGLRSLLGQAPQGVTPSAEVALPAPVLRRVVFEAGAGREAARVALPTDFLPLDLAQGPRGALWVSGLASDWSRVTLEPAAIAKALTSTTEVGRVLQIEPSGQVSTRLSGLLAVMSLTRFPADDTPLYTAMRFGPTFKASLSSPVGMAVKWVAESYKQSSVPLRAMEWTSLLPPYLPPSVLAQ